MVCTKRKDTHTHTKWSNLVITTQDFLILVKPDNKYVLLWNVLFSHHQTTLHYLCIYRGENQWTWGFSPTFSETVHVTATFHFPLQTDKKPIQYLYRKTNKHTHTHTHTHAQTFSWGMTYYCSVWQNNSFDVLQSAWTQNWIGVILYNMTSNNHKEHQKAQAALPP